MSGPGLYDPTSIMNADVLAKCQREGWIKLAVYLLSFFYYLYGYALLVITIIPLYLFCLLCHSFQYDLFAHIDVRDITNQIMRKTQPIKNVIKPHPNQRIFIQDDNRSPRVSITSQTPTNAYRARRREHISYF